MTQTKKQSLSETLVSVAIGFAVAFFSNLYVLPWFGFNVSTSGAMGIGVIFTVISIARGYLVRRLFNRWHAPDPEPEEDPWVPPPVEYIETPREDFLLVDGPCAGEVIPGFRGGSVLHVPYAPEISMDLFRPGSELVDQQIGVKAAKYVRKPIGMSRMVAGRPVQVEWSEWQYVGSSPDPL